MDNAQTTLNNKTKKHTTIFNKTTQLRVVVESHKEWCEIKDPISE